MTNSPKTDSRVPATDPLLLFGGKTRPDVAQYVNTDLMTILYIDDDIEDREFFQEAVNSLDNPVQCYTATDGADGMRTLREMMVMPDYIFVDVNMPIMNGKQFLVEIKKQPRLRLIPVIMYSTTNHPGERKEYLSLGAHQVLVKPTSLAKISALIRSVISRELVDNPRP